MKLGIIGLDTSHAEAFTRALHADGAGPRVTAAWAGGSPDLELSASRVEGIARRMQEEHGVVLLASPEAVAERCEGLLILSMDGRTRREQVGRVARWGRPLFIDKPLALGTREAAEIAEEAGRAGMPWFSASVLRFAAEVEADVRGGEARVEAPLLWNEGSPGWFWYGVHAVELLLAAMGPGVAELRVTSMSAGKGERLEARWRDGRAGGVDGRTDGAGEFAFWREGRRTVATPDFVRLSARLVKFFTTRRAPVPVGEMLEAVAILEAANQSRATGGEWVRPATA